MVPTHDESKGGGDGARSPTAWISAVGGLLVGIAAIVGVFLHNAVGPGGPASSSQPTASPTTSVSDPGTAGPTSATLDPPQPTAFSLLPGDLGMGVPIANLVDCTGEFVVLLGSTGEPDEYHSKVGDLLAAHPNARYLRTDQSCRTFHTSSHEGNPIYAVYLGPYSTQALACDFLDATPDPLDAHVRSLRMDRAHTHEPCACAKEAESLPKLSRQSGQSEGARFTRRIVDLQAMLAMSGFGPIEASGKYDQVTENAVRRFQEAYWLDVDGVVGSETWTALQSNGGVCL